MSLPIYQRVAVTDAGDVIPGAEYTVINENTGVAAPIYSDRAGATLLSAPYFADSVGTIQFFIAQGTTFRVAASGGVGTYTDRYIYGISEAVFVSDNGNVGIGTSSPDADIHVVPAEADINDPFSGIRVSRTPSLKTSQYGNMSFANGALSLTSTVSGSGGQIKFLTSTNGTSASETARIDSSGNLLVGGTTAIGSSSTIYQAGDSRNATTFVSSAPTQPYGLQVRYTVANPNSTVNGFFEAYAWNGSSYLQKFVVRSNGGIANFQANDVNLSDESEKKNITDPGSTWSCLKEWDVIQYHYNFDADDSDKKYGVIAQQVEAYCPEVISDFKTQEKIDEVLWVDDDELPEGVSVGDVKTAAQDEVVRKGVKEQQMMWMAIKALQEAQARIESLEKRITTLEAK